MKTIYIKPITEVVKMMSETSVLAAISKGEVNSEGDDSNLPSTGNGEIPDGGNGDNVDPAKKHNAWANWED